jgi:predicted nuclease with TOPRIM domain
MIDIRIATDPERVEILSKILKNSSFTEFGVAISSIIPAVNAFVVKKAAAGADILLIASQSMDNQAMENLSVGHVEFLELPEDDDEPAIKKALEEGVMRSAMQCIHILSSYNEMETEIQHLKEKEREYLEMRTEYAELKEKEIQLEKLTAEADQLLLKVKELEDELETARTQPPEGNDIQTKDLFSFPLDNLWKDITQTPPPRNEDIEVAIKRLNLEGSVMVSCGYLAAPSREEALDILRIVKIALDLQKGTLH